MYITGCAALNISSKFPKKNLIKFLKLPNVPHISRYLLFKKDEIRGKCVRERQEEKADGDVERKTLVRVCNKRQKIQQRHHATQHGAKNIEFFVFVIKSSISLRTHSPPYVHTYLAFPYKFSIILRITCNPLC